MYAGNFILFMMYSSQIPNSCLGLYTTPSRMSQLLAEAMKDVQRAEEHARDRMQKNLEKLEEAVLQRNGTGYPRLGQPKLWWVPAANASRPERARLPRLSEPRNGTIPALDEELPERARPPSRWPQLPQLPALPYLPHWPTRPHAAGDARLHRTRRMLPAPLDRRFTGARQLLQESELTEVFGMPRKWYYWNCSHESFFPHACKDGEPLWRPQQAHARRLLQTAWADADPYLTGGPLVPLHRPEALAGAQAPCAQLHNMSHLALALSTAAIATCLLTIMLLAVAWRRMQQQPAPDKPAPGKPAPPAPPAPPAACPPRSDAI
jgi:hypothetical protein